MGWRRLEELVIDPFIELFFCSSFRVFCQALELEVPEVIITSLSFMELLQEERSQLGTLRPGQSLFSLPQQ